ncbi:MAG: hypothetical protein CK424_01755 [Legionella sp.]|nr:MAG: hypothetical protein CK424_01755 [Legionella sp.]
MEQKTEWKFIGSGSSHVAFVDKDKKWVFKMLIPDENDMRHPYEDSKRSVRIYNEINKNLTRPAKEIEIDNLPPEYSIRTPAHGWISAYIDGRQATDEEIKALVLYIYNTTGRILIDATTMGNCLTLPDGRCVCVDIDLALKLDREEDNLLSDPLPRASFASLETWNSFQKKIPEYGLAAKENHFPLTSKLIKALIFIKSIRPDIRNVSLLNGPTELNWLASAYDEMMSPLNTNIIINLAQDLLEQERPAHLSNLKSTCVDLITPFSREELSDTNNRHVLENIQIICKKLIQDIHDAVTFEELIGYIEEIRAIQSIKIYPGLNSALGKCLLASDSLHYVNNRKSLVHVAYFFSKYTYSKSNLLSMLFIHAIDLASISLKIGLPIFFLNTFSQNPDRTQFSFLILMVLFLPLFSELKNKLLIDISTDVIEKFTLDLLEVLFNPNVNSVERFTKAFTSEYTDHISVFIRQTYGKLLPVYIDLFGFTIALGFKDKLIGGIAASAVFLYLAYTFYFLNPRYTNSFKSNLAENQQLFERLRTSIGMGDFIQLHNQQDHEKDAIKRVVKNALSTTKNKSYYDSQTKILGILTGHVTFLVGAIYWGSTYQQSEESLTDYILLFYYLYMFAMRLNQMSPLLSQLLSSAEYTKRLIQYSMWSDNKAQSLYKDKIHRSIAPHGLEQNNNGSQVWDLTRIAFHNVSYIHSNPEQMLLNFNFSIQKNEFFAFVGKELGDQFALVQLLLKKAIPSNGTIMFDSLDINTLDKQALYSFLAIIDSKDEFIDRDSWLDTIKYGNKNASDSDVLEAARAAELIGPDDNINTLKNRVVNIINDHDTNRERLEKRRLAIARAILKGGLCLILDNPTKDLAHHDEISILKTLINLSANIPTIMITDKLYLLDRYVNRIFYLQKEIMEQGTYDELTAITAAHTHFYKNWFQQRQDLHKLYSPPSKFSTILDQHKSLIKKHFCSVGYQNQNVQQYETDSNEEQCELIGDNNNSYLNLV